MSTSDKYKLDLSLVKKLIKIIESSDVNEIELEEAGVKIRVARNPQTTTVTTIPVHHSANVTQPQINSNTGQSESNVEKIPEQNLKLHEVKSPIVGTFYRSSSPDSPSFVEVGSKVTSGSAICIIEAMKLMNEIQSDVSGKIVKILVENGKAVEYNQPLFLIEL
ncbi:MAG: acetyl-CoA carboxylase biotin carboxyl carrier protein [Ignavibacteria bacterium]|nr:acetyl-CoA carboxylase biotin carboxyl carrier protein [Bacteroidota bacterium]MSQ46130.1 acetyl-CoA carboxylase biotin carboxyl carrier protein [Ignavibacteria bacterium]